MLTALKLALAWVLDRDNRKVVLAGAVLIALVITVATCRGAQQDAQDARVEAEISNAGVEVLEGARRADDQAVANLEASKIAIRKAENENRKETDAALAKHSEWASEPVPDDVVRSLRND